MAAQKGRDLLVKKNSVAIGAQRETSVSFDGSPVEVTSKDSDGYRTFAAFSGSESLDISVSGVWDDDTLRDAALAGTGTSKLLTDITLEWGDGATLSGDFYLATLESAGTHDGEETYSATLQSSGTFTHTSAV